MVARASAGQGTGRPFSKPGTCTLGGGRPQTGVGVEPMDQGSEGCSGLAGKAATLEAPPEVADATRAHDFVGTASRKV
jgi:hypothetical protein